MSDFDEIEVMKKLAAALEPLDEAARRRVLVWAVSRYQSGRVSQDLNVRDQAEDAGRRGGSNPEFETFADLFDATNPETDREKALVASYWAQVCDGQPSFAAQTLNAQLKDLGHRVGNITEALTALKVERPALVLQLKKSGTSKQARKTYKLTQEGIRRIQGMLGDEPGSQ